MRAPIEALVLSGALLLVPAAARPADEQGVTTWEEGEPLTENDAPEATPAPSTTPPSQAVPAPPSQIPSPPAEAQAAPAQGVPAGQWVYTDQYGWIWIPYSDSYTYVPQDWGNPYEYVYYPAYGWTWVAAPWIFGWGPWPFFGVVGAVNFGWFGAGFGFHNGPFFGHPFYGHGYPYRTRVPGRVPPGYTGYRGAPGGMPGGYRGVPAWHGGAPGGFHGGASGRAVGHGGMGHGGGGHGGGHR